MKYKSSRLLFIAGAGAELSWLIAWASFLLVNCFNRIYPLPEAIGTFFLAAMVTRFLRGRGWRAIQIIGLQLTGFICCMLRVVYVFYYPSEPFWSRIWLMDFFGLPRGHLEWFLLIFVFGYTVAFWIAGIRRVYRKRSYDIVCSSFDRGVAAFFLLFLIKLILSTQMDVVFKDSMPLYYVFPFFLFGLTEVGLARDQGNGHQMVYLTGYRAVGIFSGFALGVLILGAGIFLLFLPHLTTATAAGYTLIKDTAKPLAPFLIALIRFLFGFAKSGPESPRLSSRSAGTDFGEAGETAGWMYWVEKICVLGGVWLLVLIGAVGVCIGLWYGIRWLFIKRTASDDAGADWGLVSIVIIWLQTMLDTVCRWLAQPRKERNAGQYYAALLRWGRRSGLPHRSSETPKEYGFRLANRFPNLKTEIGTVVDMFQCEFYGESSLNLQELATVHYAWHKLRAPMLWPFRIKSFFHPH